jgi:DoxX-like protein
MQTSQRTNVLLWIVQGALAALFLFAGGFKLVAPIAMLKGPVELPGLFLKFIGLAEVAGALGLVLPGILHVQRGLTPLAAVGLVIIMTGATTTTIEGGALGPAVLPFVVGLLALSIVYGRRQWAPIGWSPARAHLAPQAV